MRKYKLFYLIIMFLLLNVFVGCIFSNSENDAEKDLVGIWRRYDNSNKVIFFREDKSFFFYYGGGDGSYETDGNRLILKYSDDNGITSKTIIYKYTIRGEWLTLIDEKGIHHDFIKMTDSSVILRKKVE